PRHFIFFRRKSDTIQPLRAVKHQSNRLRARSCRAPTLRGARREGGLYGMVFVLRGDLENSCPFDIQPAFVARPNRRRGRGDQPFTHRVLVYGNCGIPGEVAPVERNLATVYAPMLKEVSNGLGAVNLTSDE